MSDIDEPDDQAIENMQIEHDIEDKEQAALEAAEEERQMELEIESMDREHREMVESEHLAELEENGGAQNSDADDPDDD